VCILGPLQSKAIRTGSVLETTTFSSQSATILVTSLLLDVVFFDLSRYFVVFVCLPDCQFLLFFMYVLVFILPFLPLLCHCFQFMICIYVCYVLLNKYLIVLCIKIIVTFSFVVRIRAVTSPD